MLSEFLGWVPSCVKAYFLLFKSLMFNNHHENILKNPALMLEKKNCKSDLCRLLKGTKAWHVQVHSYVEELRNLDKRTDY